MEALLIMGIIILFLYFFFQHKAKEDAEFEAEEKKRREEQEREKAEKRKLLETLKKAEEQKQFEELCLKIKNSSFYITVFTEIRNVINSHINEIKDCFLTENNDDYISISIECSNITISSYNGFKPYPVYHVYSEGEGEDMIFKRSDIIDRIEYDKSRLIETHKFELNKMGFSNLSGESRDAFVAILKKDLSKFLAETNAVLEHEQNSITLEIHFNNCYKQVKSILD